MSPSSTSIGARFAMPGMAARLRSQSAAYAAFCCLVGLAFLLGGGSRADITSLIVLRPIAALLLGFALFLPKPPAARLYAPFWLLLLLALVMIVQLVPLPHGVWTALPGRELIAANDRTVGIGEIWRPISFSPGRTMNSLFSLVVPIAAFVLVSRQWPGAPRRLLWPLLVAASLSALLGLLQILGPAGSPLYFYAVTNADNAVGLFSNRNHHAIFLASMVPLVAYLAIDTEAQGARRAAIQVACAGAIVFAVLLILAIGSRAGALLALAALAATAVMWAAFEFNALRRTGRAQPRRLMLASGGAALAVAAMAALLLLAPRSDAFERLFAEQLDGEMRVRLLPQLWQMVWEYFPVGTGFGTFELAYKATEPFELLETRYLNHAHNDVLQVLIEGGFAAAAIALAFLGWFAARSWSAARRLIPGAGRESHAIELQPFACVSLAILLLGSIGDYPFRTPSIMVMAAILCALVGAAPGSAVQRGRRSRARN